MSSSSDASRSVRKFNRPLVHQLKDESFRSFGFFQPVDVANIGMVQRGQDFGFALEPRQPVRIIRESLRQHLERHVPVELGVSRPIHFPMPPSPSLAVTEYGPRVVPGERFVPPSALGDATRRG